MVIAQVRRMLNEKGADGTFLMTSSPAPGSTKTKIHVKLQVQLSVTADRAVDSHNNKLLQ